MDDEYMAYELRIKKLLKDMNIFEPDIEDYLHEDMHQYYKDRAYYKKKFDVFQNEIINGRIELGD